MGDLIDRQAVAIDMLQNLAYKDWNQGVSESWVDAFRKCVEIIRDLPSARPEIIRCRDCEKQPVCRFEQYQGNDGYCSLAERKGEQP